MTTWIVIIVLFILLLVYLLWMPIVLKIDTATNEYYLQFKGLAKVSVLGDEKEVIKIRLDVLFTHFNLFPLRKRTRKKKHIEKPQKKKKKWTVAKGQKALRVIRTFKVKQLVLEMDTGDYVLNAKLYPLFFMLNSYHGYYAINFKNRNRLALQIENRPIHLIKSIINL